MLFYGPSSDHYDPCPIVLFGLIFGSIFGYLWMFYQNIEQCLMARILQGLGCGVCVGLGKTMIGDVLSGFVGLFSSDGFGVLIVLFFLIAITQLLFVQIYKKVVCGHK